MNLTGKNIAILGAGRSGLGAAKLALKLGGIPVVFDDGGSKNIDKVLEDFEREGVTTVLGLDDAKKACEITRFDLAVISPGLDASWPLPQLFNDSGIPLIAEIEFAWRELSDTPIVAITGTNGKTTTTELLQRVFNGCGKRTIACGNYGLALSEVAFSGEKYDVLMVEVSSFQLETITSFQPKVVIWLNFAPDHLDRYPNNDAYFAAKKRVFEFMGVDDFAIIRAGETFDVSIPKISFTTDDNVKADFTLRDEAIWFRGVRVASVSKFPLIERHNIENQMAVIATGWYMGLTFEGMLKALEGYSPAKHRCELVRTIQGRRYINDSKSTNLHALETCLKSQDESVVLIAGGKEKGLDYLSFRPLLAEKVTTLVVIGEIAEKLCELFSDIVPCHQAASVQEAVSLASAMARPLQSIVFSPGTSSFDMFSGYVERGNVFCEAVMALPEINQLEKSIN